MKTLAILAMALTLQGCVLDHAKGRDWSAWRIAVLWPTELQALSITASSNGLVNASLSGYKTDGGQANLEAGIKAGVEAGLTAAKLSTGLK